MAFIGQDKKAEIAAELKKVMPVGWKYSLGIHHHSTLVLTISEAPTNLITEYVSNIRSRKPDTCYTGEEKSIDVNVYWIRDNFTGERLEQMTAIKAALMKGNHDNSDSQTDYFDVGWYIDIKFGRYDRPFKVSSKSGNAATDLLLTLMAMVAIAFAVFTLGALPALIAFTQLATMLKF